MALQSVKRLTAGAQSEMMLPDDLVHEILTWLPGKELGRCKCVCKSWISIIKTPLFRQTYRSRQGCLILHCSESLKGTHRFFHFYCSNARQLKVPTEKFFRPIYKLFVPVDDGIIEQMVHIVNGLACIGKCEKGFGQNVDQLIVYSVCTGQKMAIPEPEPYVGSVSTFHLGYDPATRTYKLLRLIFPIRNGNVINWRPMRANIMSLRPSGNLSRWRKVKYNVAGMGDLDLPTSLIYDAVRSDERSGRVFSEDDGVLSWFHRDVLILFDLNQEKFRRFKLPEEVTKRGRWVVGTWAQFVEGRLQALCLWVEVFPRLVCFVLEDDKGEKWSEHRVKLPGEAPDPADLDFVTGRSLISWQLIQPGGALFSQFRDAYSYGCRMNMMERFWVENYRVGCPFPFNIRRSYLGDANHLYLPLDDVLRG